jgi:hypothetical protein
MSITMLCFVFNAFTVLKVLLQTVAPYWTVALSAFCLARITTTLVLLLTSWMELSDITYAAICVLDIVLVVFQVVFVFWVKWTLRLLTFIASKLIKPWMCYLPPWLQVTLQIGIQLLALTVKMAQLTYTTWRYTRRPVAFLLFWGGKLSLFLLKTAYRHTPFSKITLITLRILLVTIWITKRGIITIYHLLTHGIATILFYLRGQFTFTP